MPNLNAFHAFNSTSGGAGGGCFLWKTMIVIVVLCVVLTLIGKSSG